MTDEEFKVIELISKISIDRASQVFSKILKAGSRIEITKIHRVDITELTEKISDDDREVSGAIVQLEGDAPTKLLFLVGYENALTLTDLFLRREIGTTKEFDALAESTIQELGNILASSISNVFVKDFEINLSPCPPVVLNDYSSSIFNSVLMSDEAIMASDEILLIETKFYIVRTAFDCTLFLLPTLESTKVILKRYIGNNN